MKVFTTWLVLVWHLCFPVAKGTEDKTVLALFEKLSSVAHPPGGEEGIRRIVLDLVQAAPDALKKEIKTRIDDQGNLFVSLPGTGKYAGLKLAPIILQAHMDMVEAVRNVSPNADLTPYFAGGVKFMTEKGWIFSKDKSTTLGADNLIGMALALRYLVEPTLEHPPLLFLFTVCEEGGPACDILYKRAPEIVVPSDVPVLINLDVTSNNSITYGSPGYRRAKAAVKVPSVAVPREHALVRVAFLNVKGGHSGNDIHRSRLNPVQAAATVLSELSEKYPEMLFLRAQSGGKMSAIATSAELVISVPKDQVKKASATALSRMRRLVAAKSDEDPKKIQLIAEPIEKLDGAARGIKAKDTQRIARVVLAIKHGIAVKGSYPPYANNWKAATNVGTLELSPEPSGDVSTVTAGFYTRSCLEPELDRLEKQNTALLKGLAENPTDVILTPGSAPAWLADTKTWLYRIVRERLPRFRLEVFTGGIEPRDFAQKAPGLEMLAMGPNVRDAHSPDESLEIASITPTIVALDKLIQGIGEASEYRNWKGPNTTRVGPDTRKGN